MNAEFTPQAAEDLDGIWWFIAEDNLGAILDHTKFPNYVIVYRPEKSPLQVIAVLHGKRDLNVPLMLM